MHRVSLFFTARALVFSGVLGAGVAVYFETVDFGDVLLDVRLDGEVAVALELSGTWRRTWGKEVP